MSADGGTDRDEDEIGRDGDGGDADDDALGPAGEAVAFVLTVAAATGVYWVISRADVGQLVTFAVVLAAVYLLVRLYVRRGD